MPAFYYFPSPPEIKTGAQNAIVSVFDRGTNHSEKKLTKLFIQNLATTTAKYLINASATSGNLGDSGAPSASVFNGILAAGTAQDDGLGGVFSFDCEDLKIQNVIVYSDTGSLRVVATKFFDPSSI